MTSPARGGPDTDDKREPCGCRSAYVHDHGCTKFERATGPDTAGMREAIVGALWRYRFGGRVTSSATVVDVVDVADALLPVVQLLAVEKAAEELRAAAAELAYAPAAKAQWLRARADALAAATQPTDGRTER